MTPKTHLNLFGSIRVRNKYLNLTMLTAGREDTASTRLRAWPILDRMVAKRELSLDDLLSSNSHCNSVLWFQKKITDQHLLIARKYKKEGALIVYDCDESGPALSYWAQPHQVFEMFHLADQIIADTPERIQWIKNSKSLARISILENQIDYGIPANILENKIRKSDDQRIRILWYGNSSNLAALKEALSFFKDSNDFQLVLCGATAHDANMMLPGCELEIHRWSRSTFLNILRNCDLCILSHNGSRSDYQKSGHKMITSICHGIPVVASATPDYKRIARYAGVEDYLFSNITELEEILTRLKDPDARSKYLSIAKPPLLERYYPGSFAENAIAILDRAYQKPSDCPRIYQKVLGGKLGPFGSKFLQVIGKTYWHWMQAS